MPLSAFPTSQPAPTVTRPSQSATQPWITPAGGHVGPAITPLQGSRYCRGLPPEIYCSLNLWSFFPRFGLHVHVTWSCVCVCGGGGGRGGGSRLHRLYPLSFIIAMQDSNMPTNQDIGSSVLPCTLAATMATGAWINSCHGYTVPNWMSCDFATFQMFSYPSEPNLGCLVCNNAPR